MNVYWAVYHAVDGAVRGAVHHTVDRAVYEAVDRAVGRAVYTAVVRKTVHWDVIEAVKEDQVLPLDEDARNILRGLRT